MTEPVAPPLPPDCDLRDFAYMPLDVVRLRDADICSIPPEAFRAAVISWCVAWHQIPAASLPDDDAALCRLLGYGRDVKGWQKLRAAGALRGYVRCSDGRLYHMVVAEKAAAALAGKRAQRDRTEAARMARLSHRVDNGMSQSLSQTGPPSVTDNVTIVTAHNVTASKGELRESKGKGRKKESRSLRSLVESGDEFEAFWSAYPRKTEGPGACRKAWQNARKTATFQQIYAGLGRYPFKPDFLPMAATWLNQQRWMTQDDTPPATTAIRRNGQPSDISQLIDELSLDLITPIEDQFPAEDHPHGSAPTSPGRRALAHEAGASDRRREDPADKAADWALRDDAH